jgi:hypothetical protein
MKLKIKLAEEFIEKSRLNFEKIFPLIENLENKKIDKTEL